jgi:hypothetical protein
MRGLLAFSSVGIGSTSLVKVGSSAQVFFVATKHKKMNNYKKSTLAKQNNQRSDVKNLNNPVYKTTNVKIKKANVFIQKILSSKQGLRRLGILRSNRYIQGDYAEWLIAELLNLKVAPNAVQEGYDAEDASGKTYQIKGRIVENLSSITSFDFKHINYEFDFLICVFISDDFKFLGALKIPYKTVKALGNQNKKSFRFRWNKKISTNKSVEKLFWGNQ